MTEQAKVTQAEFARLQGWSRSHVTGLKQAGRLVMDGKRVDVKASLARIEATKDPNRDDVSRRHKEGRSSKGGVGDVPTTEKPKMVPPSQQSPMDERVSSTYQQSRAVKERYLALQAKAQYEKDIGKLVDVALVSKAGADLGTHLRSALENLQDRLAPELAPESDPARIHALLGEQFEYTLTEISRKLGDSVRGSDG